MVDPIGLTLGILGCAIAVFLSGIGSAKGISLVASVASGVVAEAPEKFGSLFLLVALPGTQGFYGFLGAFLALTKMGLFGNLAPITLWQGAQILGACLPVAVAGLVSAIAQGRVCASGAQLVAKRSEEAMKAVVYGAMVETYAVLGLLATIFLLMGIKL
ncbi:MAG: V-type ATP synthase subunit K [candidate division WOR-3 bacterium]